MNVGIYPSRESAILSLQLELSDVAIVAITDCCCHTTIIVPSGMYLETFESSYDTYIPGKRPIAHSIFELAKPLEEVKVEIGSWFPEARFFENRAKV